MIAFLVIHPMPVPAGDFSQPENFTMVDAWLTSDPQPGVDYHVLRACIDPEMRTECTQCIYKAKDDGSVWIPSENRCIFRVSDYYVLYFQLKSVAIDGGKSDWTAPSSVYVTRTVGNGFGYGSSWTWVRYDFKRRGDIGP